MLLLAVYSSGFALAVAVGAVFFRDLRYLWTIIIQVLFFATPIIYTPDVLVGKLHPYLEFILHWNPMAVFISSFRHLLYDGRAPEFGHVVYLACADATRLVWRCNMAGRCCDVPRLLMPQARRCSGCTRWSGTSASRAPTSTPSRDRRPYPPTAALILGPSPLSSNGRPYPQTVAVILQRPPL